MEQEKLVFKFQQLLPQRIRRYLGARGVTEDTIKRFRLGWNGQRITIPVYGRDGQFRFFRLAKDPDSLRPTPKMLSGAGTQVELYGWERLLQKPQEIVICEGEFDRLALEGRGFSAVTSTAGAGSFKEEWATFFNEIAHVYVCFDLDEAGRLGSRTVASLIPHARVVKLPSELGRGGDITDYLAVLGKSAADFRNLLNRAQPIDRRERIAPREQGMALNSATNSDDVARIKSETTIEWIVNRYVRLRKSGRNFIGCCPFHTDRTPSFVVFPDSQSFHCFGCRVGGDCVSFLMRRESLSFPEAIDALKILNHL